MYFLTVVIVTHCFNFGLFRDRNANLRTFLRPSVCGWC